MLVSLDIPMYSVCIQGEANDLINLIQHDIFCDVILYASHYLCQKSLQNRFSHELIKQKYGQPEEESITELEENNWCNLSIGIDFIWSWFVSSDPHTNPVMLHRIPVALNDLP